MFARFYQQQNGANVVGQLGPAAWFRYGQGITVTGAGVSRWHDLSGNSPAGERDLLQATDTNRPALQADGSILFDGVDNFLKTAGFTWNHPFTIYLLFKQVTWTNLDKFYDGDTNFTGYARQQGVTPDLEVGTDGQIVLAPQLAVGQYGALCSVYNDASSSVRLNNNAAVTGDCGAASNPGGFTLGSGGDGLSLFSNIQAKEVILYSGAHTTGQQSTVINYLSGML